VSHREYKAGLIRTRRSAGIALGLTCFITILSFRALFSHVPHKPHWLVSFDFVQLPVWVVAIVNLAFYVYLLWWGVVFYRKAQDKERIVVAGWFNVILLGPVQTLVSTPAVAAIQWVKAAGMAAASFAAAYMLLKNPGAAALTASSQPVVSATESERIDRRR
jgi:hypothetical protein